MTFEPENIASFERIFSESSEHIRAFPGCLKLELLRDLNHPEVFITYSIWESESHLEAYRNSEFFRAVWARTKKLFARKPQAWSLQSRGGP